MEKKGKILIVDDNEDVLLSLNMLLKPYVEGIRVINTPERIIGMMDSFMPDVIMLDMNFHRDAISGEEGYEWLKKILAHNPKSVVLFITAYVDTEKAVRAIKAGAIDFIPKPWDRNKLLDTVKSAVELSRERNLDSSDSQEKESELKLNTIIIMTSNAGAQSIIEPKKLGFGVHEDEKQDHERMKSNVMEEVKRLFKPEFLNRIDETIVFRALNKDDMKQIVTLMTNELQKRCKDQLQINLVVRDAAKSDIVEKAYDRKYGARPLRRKIQNEIEDRLAEEIIAGKVKAGDRVVVTTKNKMLVVEKE